MLVAAIFVDVTSLKFSVWAECILNRANLKAMLFVVGCVALNMMGGIIGTVLHMRLYGFNLWMELCVSAVTHAMFNAANIHWNLTAKRSLFVIMEKNLGVKLSTHMWWSFCLGNVGLVALLYIRVTMFCITQAYLADVVPTNAPDLNIGWPAYICLAIFLVSPPVVAVMEAWYYFMHRLLHYSPTLYALVHKIHHVARYPIPSDEGTISPVEYLLNNPLFLTCVFPFPVRCVINIFMFVKFRQNHDFDRDKEQHHVLHHVVNTGNFASPAGAWLDRMFGTLVFPDTARVQKLKAQFEAIEIEMKER